MRPEQDIQVGATKVPILMYHHINDSDDWFATPELTLIEQMTWLEANGYASILPSDLHLTMTAGAPLPERPVMITIDDGNRSDQIFAAVLGQCTFRGVYFWPDTSPLSETEMAELAAQGEIGAHTRTHPDLTKLSRAKQKVEIAGNCQRLRDITGQPVRSFAYPYGKFNAASSAVVAALEFNLAFNAWGVPIAVDQIDRFHVPRFEVPHGISLDAFIARVEAWR